MSTSTYQHYNKFVNHNNASVKYIVECRDENRRLITDDREREIKKKHAGLFGNSHIPIVSLDRLMHYACYYGGEFTPMSPAQVEQWFNDQEGITFRIKNW